MNPNYARDFTDAGKYTEVCIFRGLPVYRLNNTNQFFAALRIDVGTFQLAKYLVNEGFTNGAGYLLTRY